MSAASFASKVGSSLVAEKAPYIITLFVAAFTWLLSYTAARYEKVPVVAYSVESRPADPKTPGAIRYVATFTNVSPTLAAPCLTLNLLAVDSKTGKLSALTKGPVSMLSNTLPKHALDEADGALILQVWAMQPTAELQLESTAPAGDKLRVFTTECQVIKTPATELLPVLKMKSWETWVLKNSLPVLWLVALVWAVVLVIVFATSGSKQRDEPV